MHSIAKLALSGAAAVSLLGVSWPAAASAATPALGMVNTNGVVQVRPLSKRWYGAGSYVYPTISGGVASAPDPLRAMRATGQKAFVLSFVLAADSGNDPNGPGDNATNPNGSVANGQYWSCAPTVDGNQPLSALTPYVNRIRRHGGDVAVSFGGYGGYKLAEVCGTASATAAAMQRVVSYYGLHAIDLDLEYPEYTYSPYTAREIAALAILKTHNPGLYISVTTGTTTTGVNANGQNILTDASEDGFSPNNFTIMPFDGGFTRGFASEVAALRYFHRQLVATTGFGWQRAWHHIGFSGMNGITDTAEVFSPVSLARVANWAESRHLARFTFWALQRDFQCPSNEMPWPYKYAPSTCSGVRQRPYEFDSFNVAFARDRHIAVGPLRRQR